MRKISILLFTVMFLLYGYNFLWAAPGDPVVVKTTSGDLLVGVESDEPNMILLMPSQSTYNISGDDRGMGMRRMLAEDDHIDRDLTLMNDFVTYKTRKDLIDRGKTK